MKTFQCIILSFFFLSISTTYAQISVDSQGRSIFGKVKNVTNGITIVDESTSSAPVPFTMTRKPNNNIVLNRPNGFKMFVGQYGTIAIGKRNQLRSSEATGIAHDLIATCVLSQNTPNPFTEQTEIKYFIATATKNAYICIFDMQGKMLQRWDAEAGQNSILIEGSQLEAGMYLYSLIVDGIEIDTKKMILTK